MSSGPIMILAGGTGGHVFPGLAVAKLLRERAKDVVWMGTHKGLEARLVPAAGIEMEWISVAGVRGRGPLAWLAAPFRLSMAIFQAISALRRRRPVAVLGLGGFVSGPVDPQAAHDSRAKRCCGNHESYSRACRRPRI
jgi:UDP-N-acetylglucosamine--N-acetylmuramyl-(pentapeptide) pyrophosphoryl-undecaprenol N-acetylglucosamine transferase